MNGPVCRSCGARLEHTVIDLGEQPLSNAYIYASDVSRERSYPLHARFCTHCYLVQVDDVVAPAEIFGDYAYFSSYAETWVDHARRFVEDSVARFSLDDTSFLVEIASNDGYLLKHVIARDIPCLGIEPAANVAQTAIDAGVPTEVCFFGSDVAKDLVARRGTADLVVGNNVMAHVPDLNDFVAGLALLVADDGVVSVEVPHLLELVRGLEFDTIYHEHFSYFSLLAITECFRRHGLEVFDVTRLDTHGGSLRVQAASSASGRTPTSAVGDVLDEERHWHLDHTDGFRDFADRAATCRDDLIVFLDEARASSRRVVAYGAAAKGNTLLNFAGVDTTRVEYVVDRNPYKQGRVLPGSHLPIFDPAVLVADRPDFVLILPWNLRQEIVEQMAVVRTWAGKFVVAVPAIQEVQ